MATRDDCAQSGDILIYISIDAHLMLRIFHSMHVCVCVCGGVCVLPPFGFLFACHGRQQLRVTQLDATQQAANSEQRAATHTQIASVGQGRIYLLQPQLGKRNLKREEEGGGEGARVAVGTGQRVGGEGRQMRRKVTCCSSPTPKKADEMNIELFADR